MQRNNKYTHTHKLIQFYLSNTCKYFKIYLRHDLDQHRWKLKLLFHGINDVDTLNWVKLNHFRVQCYDGGGERRQGKFVCIQKMVLWIKYECVNFPCGKFQADAILLPIPSCRLIVLNVRKVVVRCAKHKQQSLNH